MSNTKSPIVLVDNWSYTEKPPFVKVPKAAYKVLLSALRWPMELTIEKEGETPTCLVRQDHTHPVHSAQGMGARVVDQCVMQIELDEGLYRIGIKGDAPKALHIVLLPTVLGIAGHLKRVAQTWQIVDVLTGAGYNITEKEAPDVEIFFDGEWVTPNFTFLNNGRSTISLTNHLGEADFPARLPYVPT